MKQKLTISPNATLIGLEQKYKKCGRIEIEKFLLPDNKYINTERQERNLKKFLKDNENFANKKHLRHRQVDLCLKRDEIVIAVMNITCYNQIME